MAIFESSVYVFCICKTRKCGELFGVLLGRNLTLAKDKEMGFRQESDIRA